MKGVLLLKGVFLCEYSFANGLADALHLAVYDRTRILE